MMAPHDYHHFDLLTPLTFAVVAHSEDFQIAFPPGTGFFIAPYTALTAKHVVEALWDELGRPWLAAHIAEMKRLNKFGRKRRQAALPGPEPQPVTIAGSSSKQ